MRVYNKETYNNLIYTAVVVNDDKSQDPLGLNRVQIYIPKAQYQYAGIYQDYANGNKRDEHKDKFPWAVSLVEVKNNNIVYGSYIDNDNQNYIILGVEVYNPANQGVGGSNDNGVFGNAAILDLAMAIIISEETGWAKGNVDSSQYPDGIPLSYFATIENVDTKPRGLGIKQWTASRAYDLLLDISKQLPSWKSCFSDQSIDFVRQLEDGNCRTTSAVNFAFAKGSTLYNGIKSMLETSASKTVQLEKARADTESEKLKLQNDPYNLTNPALIIFLLDIMNQYGSGVNNVITGCITRASEINKTSDSNIKQLENFAEWWYSKTKQYSDRRDRVKAYISELDKQGKLYSASLVDLGEKVMNSTTIKESAYFLWPHAETDRVTSKFGPRVINGISSNHSGIDIAGGLGCKLVAAANCIVETISYKYNTSSGYYPSNMGYGNYIVLRSKKDSKYSFYYAHLAKADVLLKEGQEVKMGEVVGYEDHTGNSTASHLHFEVRINNKPEDPLPYLGKRATIG